MSTDSYKPQKNSRRLLPTITGSMVSLKTASLLFFPFTKIIISIDASTPEKFKWIFTESFKNMLAFVFSLAIWLMRCFLHTVNTFLPSSISELVDITPQGQKNIITSHPPISLTGSAIGRALSQVLALVIETPVNSRKYEFVRNLADKMIEENSKNGSLKEVNRKALSAAFGRTMKLLNSALYDDQTGGMAWKMMRRIPFLNKHSSSANDSSQSSATTITESILAEKLARDLLWFAEKLFGCWGVEDAIVQWSEAASLAHLSISAHPRVQGSIVRVTVYLLKEMAKEEQEEEEEEEGRRVKMLMLWLPLLANAANGVESAVLSGREKYEMERVVEKMIEGFAEMKDKEAVLAIWLHHYARSNSDWPNLQGCYHQWCGLSRSSLC